MPLNQPPFPSCLLPPQLAPSNPPSPPAHDNFALIKPLYQSPAQSVSADPQESGLQQSICLLPPIEPQEGGSAEPIDLGDFLESEDEIELESVAERREDYLDKNAPYCPISIGEVLDGRYRIEHKLGCGGFSTVWLAQDSRKQRSVALKVMTSGKDVESELRVQDAIIKSVPDISRFVIYQRAFYIAGPTGHHLVLVFPVRGPSFDTIYWGLQPAMRMGAAKDLLLALKSLHDAGFIHNGMSASRSSWRSNVNYFSSLSDLNKGAVMWHIDPIDHWTIEKKYRIFGRPQKVALKEVPGKQGEWVGPATIPPEIAKRPVYLGDFGLSFWEGNPRPPSFQGPVRFCAPERLHGGISSRASDMWSYMVMFAGLYLNGESIIGSGPRLVSSLVGMLGPFPKEWKKHYNEGVGPLIDWWYDHSNQLRPPPHTRIESLTDKMDRFRPDIDKDERGHALHLIRRGFCYDAKQRITATEMLAHPSFNYIMEKYGIA